MQDSNSRTHRLLLCLAALFVGASSEAQLPLQPYASYWTPDTAPNQLLSYDIDADPDARFNVGSVPLASRFSNPSLQANPNARPNEARVMSLAAFAPTSGNPSQGSEDARYYAFSHWQYVDALVFWGGSAGEGNILAPNGPVIDAAHRNGVPVYGNIFFPPGVFGGQINRLSDIVQKDPDGSFPLADKLIEVAQRNRFDGWFFNQETEGASAALAAQTREFLTYLQDNSDLDIIWYDSMIESGPIWWQGALNENNDGYFQESSRASRASDGIFVDFRWSESSLASSAAHAASVSRDPYEVFAGVNVEAAGWDQTGEPLDQVFPDGQSHRTSVGFYRPEWTERFSSGVEDFHNRDTLYWSGANKNPSDTSGTVGNAGWKGIAHYVPAKSPIVGESFVTNFNLGQGYDYWVDGELARSGDWNNLSLQDVTPTWRWWIDSTSMPLTPEFDFTDAYHGGSSLRVSGDLDGENTLRLYMTDLAVGADTNLQVAFKTPGAAMPTGMELLVAFSDNPTQFTPIPVGDSSGTDWEVKEFALSGHAGKTISQIGLRFIGDDPNYDINIGRIGVIEGTPDVVGRPSNATLLDYGSRSARSVTMRVAWEHSPDYAPDSSNGVYYYNLYKVGDDGTRIFLGGTPNDSFFVRELFRGRGENGPVTIEVVAISSEFGVSEPTSFAFDWSNLPTGIAGDYNNDGMVDAADYTMWRDNYGAEAGVLSNNPYAELIDDTQYAVWRDAFGSSSAGTSTVPEPSSAVALLTAIACFRRRRSR